MADTPPRGYITSGALAKRLGINRHTIQKWGAIGMPRRKVGRWWFYHPQACAAWRLANVMPQRGGNRNPTGAKAGGTKRPNRAPMMPQQRANDAPTARQQRAAPATPKMSRTEADTMKLTEQALLARMERLTKAGKLLDANEVRTELTRRLTDAARYLEQSQRATALRVCAELGLDDGKAAGIEGVIMDRDDELMARLRRQAQ